MSSKKFKLILILVVFVNLLILSGFYLYFQTQDQSAKEFQLANGQREGLVVSIEENIQERRLSQIAENIDKLENSFGNSSSAEPSSLSISSQSVVPVVNSGAYKTFSGEGFKNFYDNFSYSGVDKITQKPFIRGEPDVDERIQNIAERRGYKLRYEATCRCFQSVANNAWIKMKNAASSEAGLNLVLVSSFRSVADQRSIFLNQISGWSNQDIAEGRADEAINNILVTRSIPGYSKHHTGYTIDLGCNSNNLINFENTPCYRWISENNYYNAKRFGYIPSYPRGATNQGPDPEAWEYVWVGEENLKN